MSILRETTTAIKATLVFWIITAVIYPFLILGIGQLFPYQANGSLLKNSQGQVIGSALIGQPFASDRYFLNRPSTTSYSTANPTKDEAGILKTGVSGASNLAPSNPDLLKRVQETIATLKQAGIEPTADLLYTSGSSLDPHITPAGARSQLPRIARARNLDSNQLEILISQNTDSRFLGIFGEPGVNVLRLNLALDKLGST